MDLREPAGPGKSEILGHTPCKARASSQQARGDNDVVYAKHDRDPKSAAIRAAGNVYEPCDIGRTRVFHKFGGYELGLTMTYSAS